MLKNTLDFRLGMDIYNYTYKHIAKFGPQKTETIKQEEKF